MKSRVKKRSLFCSAAPLAAAVIALTVALGGLFLIHTAPAPTTESLPGSAAGASGLLRPAACGVGDGGYAAFARRQSEDVPLTLVMVGDLLMHRFVQNSGRLEGGYSFEHLFANVKDEISSADLAIINQETLLAGEEFGLSGYPLFNAPREVADAIESAGFDVVLQATNHSLDRGAAGLMRCLSYWEEKHPGVITAGCAANEADASRIRIAERRGIRVAVLNYTYGTNGIPLPEGMPWSVCLLEEEAVRSDIARARRDADFVVVCPHWGVEYMHTPSDEQRRWCGVFLECGADLVIGTHPHVVQPVEWYEREDGHRMLVYYSLGNFVNSTAERGEGICNRMLGGMAKVILARDDDGGVYIASAVVLPLITQVNDGFAGVTTYLFSDYTEDLAAQNTLLRSRDPRFSYKYCDRIFREVFGNFLA